MDEEMNEIDKKLSKLTKEQAKSLNDAFNGCFKKKPKAKSVKKKTVKKK